MPRHKFPTAFSRWAALALVLALSGARGAVAAPAPGASARTANDKQLFDANQVYQMRLTVPAESIASLQRNPRRDVAALLEEGGQTFHPVGLHLKGTTGSFRSIENKPSLTLSFDEFGSSQRFHGLRKIHLNNSVEDATYLHEKIGAELFRKANVPAPRVSHARVTLNGRDLGPYVLKEGFVEEFLALHFRRTDGNLYEVVSGEERNGMEPMKRNAGAGLDDQTDLQKLAEAVRQTDAVNRWQRFEEVLDIDQFLSFMAMEVLIGHRDGYCLARNNFRLYHDPASDRFVFLPTGMDQLFGKTNAPIEPHMAGLVARAVMETEEGRRRYRERLALLFTNIFQVKPLANSVHRSAARLASSLPRDEARALMRQEANLGERIRLRVADVARQLALPTPGLLRFQDNIARLTGWSAVDVPKGGRLEQAVTVDGRSAFRILAGPATAASWRVKVLLPAGRYRFEGEARTTGVKPLAFGKNHGAGLTVFGRTTARSELLLGDNPWSALQVIFEMGEGQTEVELFCTLRASGGDAWFDIASLRLVRLSEQAR